VVYLGGDIHGAISPTLSELLELAVLVSELGVKSAYFLSQVTDLLNQFHVLLHNVVVILLVNLSLLFQTLLE